MTNASRISVAALLLAAPLATRAVAIDDDVHDDFRFALHGASALCHNLALSPAYPERARKRLAGADKTLAAAADLAEQGAYLPALGKAKKGVTQATAASAGDPVLRTQVYVTLANVTEASRALVRAAIDDVAREHPADAGRASLPYARALAEQHAQDFDDALALLRKAIKKIARVL